MDQGDLAGLLSYARSRAGMLEPGERIDVWVVEQVLGSGGMGAVYRCHNYAASRILAAVKVLEAGHGAQPALRARFVREAELLFGLDHPNIVKVRNVRMDATPPFIEMAFVEGESLESRLERGGLPEADVVAIGAQLAGALAYIHARQIAHRDVKPGNLLLRGGHVTLVDFGIAAEADGTAITHAGQHMGTVAYVPPEWGSGKPVDPYRWDLYALGLVLHECLTGRVVFPSPRDIDARQAVFAVMAAKREHPALDPGPVASGPLRRLIRELTEPNPAVRLSSAAEAAQRLAALLPSGTALQVPERGHTPLGPSRTAEHTTDLVLPEEPASPATPPAAPAAPTNRRPLVAAGVAVTGLGLLGVTALVATVVLAAAFGPWRAPATRDLQVVLTDLPDGIPVELRSGDLAATVVEPGVLLLPSLAPPSAPLRLAIGGTDCAAGCLDLDLDAAIQPGEGPQLLRWSLPPRGVADLVVRAPDAPTARVGLGDVAPTTLVSGQATLTGITPGRHRLWAQAGTCPEPAPCGEGCAAGCVEQQVVVDVPWEGGRVEVPLTLKAPVAPGVAAAAVARPGTRPTRADFAAFLATSPDWTPEAARARGDAGPTYLRGWSGGAPPAPVTAAMTDVSWAAAAAYCASRGGLASVDDLPTTWPDGGGAPWLEHRQRDGAPAWRRSDGAASEPGVVIARGEANPTLGFRCRK